MSNDSNQLPAYHVPNTTSGSYEPPLVVHNRYIGVTNTSGVGTLSANQEVVFTTVPAPQPTVYLRASLIEDDMEQIRAIVGSEIEKALGRSVFVLLSLAQVRDELSTRREQSDIDRVLVWVNEAIEELADTPGKDIRTLVAQEVRKALHEQAE